MGRSCSWAWTAAVVLHLAVLPAGCSTDGLPGTSGHMAPGVRVTCDAGAPAVAVEWDRLNGSSPYPGPSDYFTVSDPDTGTGRRLHFVGGENIPESHFYVQHLSFALQELNTLDGWGTTGSGIVRFGGKLDPAACGAIAEQTTYPRQRQRLVLDGTERVLFILNIDPRAGAPYGEHRGVIVDAYEDGSLIFEPLYPLDPATRYAVVLTRGLVAEGRGCVTRAPAWQEALSGSGADPGLNAFVREGIDAVLAADPVLDEDDLVLVLPFTTQTTIDDLLEAREQILAMPPPEIEPGSLTVETLAEGPIAAKIRGSFLTPDLQAHNGIWIRDGTAGPLVVAGEKRKEFLLQIPREGQGGRFQPFPLAIYLHGLSMDMESADGGAAQTVEQGVATISVSAVAHEGVPAFLRVPLFFNLFEVAFKSPTAFRTVRDNFRQSTIDQLQALRLARRLMDEGFDAAAPIGTPDLDPDAPMGAAGISLGGIMGTTLTALAPEIDYALLSSGGGSVSKILFESDTISFLVDLFTPLLLPGVEVSEADLAVLMGMMQAIFEAGDPANFARHVFTEPLSNRIPGAGRRHVLFFAEIDDAIVPNSATEVLMRAMNVPQLEEKYGAVSGLTLEPAPVRGNIASDVTAGLFRYELGHGRSMNSSEGKIQAGRFIRTFFEGLDAGIGPQIIDPFEEAR